MPMIIEIIIYIKRKYDCTKELHVLKHDNIKRIFKRYPYLIHGQIDRSDTGSNTIHKNIK